MIFHVFAILLIRYGRFLRAKPCFEGPSHLQNGDISWDVLHKSRFWRFLFKTPSDLIRRSPGPPWGKFWKPKMLFGLPKKSAESRLRSLCQTPNFLGGFVNVQKRIRVIAFSNNKYQMGWSVLYFWVLKFKANKTAHDPFWRRLQALFRLSRVLLGNNSVLGRFSVSRLSSRLSLFLSRSLLLSLSLSLSLSISLFFVLCLSLPAWWHGTAGARRKQ